MDIDATIRRARAKDPKALNEIYTAYHSKMVGVCMNIVREDEDTARDLVHDAFVLAFASLDKLKDNGKFVEWLTTIVRNVALKHLAQKKKMHLVSLSQIDMNDMADNSSAADNNIKYQDILNSIAQLPEGYGKVFRLSVIEGFSHKEIAGMLGIEPHSSSSQLSRAKGLLKRMLDYKKLAVIIVSLVSVSLYIIMPRREATKVCEVKLSRKKEVREKEMRRIGQGEKHKTPPDSPDDKANMNHQAVEKHLFRTDDAKNASDSIDIHFHQNVADAVEGQKTITAMKEDCIVTLPEDSALISITDSGPLLANETNPKKKKWKLLAAGSLGPDLAQNVYKMFKTGDIGDIGTDVPSPVFPENINTWEDYSKYLHIKEHGNTPADTLALIEIADHNNGEIIEREEHDKPFTFGISFNKTLNGRWSMETGIQYSLLNSRFTAGGDGYSIVRKQKVHYLGVPMKLSYRMIAYKRMSAYSSAGLTLHIPVYGKMKSSYIVDWQTAYSYSHSFTPPLQWQTSISVGLQYRLTPSMSIFAEPTLSWLIPSGSDTHTIWTEHPVMLTCPFGIRINW